MNVKILENPRGTNVIYMINAVINFDSRFTCVAEPYRNNIRIRQIRLKEKKPYCGSHPNACEVNNGRKPRAGKWLEGADWVEFNDRLNDIFDEFNISANIYSMVCWLRKGRRRRTRYLSHWDRAFWEWDRDDVDDVYVDYCGKVAPNSEYPEGTPGLYERDLQSA